MKHATIEHPIALTLVAWFVRVGKDYPWRKTHDPWAILVSEVMLQQTTIPTVLARYEDWMARYPTPQALAMASEDEALLSWEGLGYYRRVRNLRAAAKLIVERHKGIFPRDAQEIAQLPGIGAYTLGAILSFAFNQAAPLVDANVSRVFARLFDDHTPIDSSMGKKKQWQQAQELLHRSNPRAYNAALMELGQQCCHIKQPQCSICPIKAYCKTKQADLLPIKKAKIAIEASSHCDILVFDPEKGLLMMKQGNDLRHAGMLRFPTRPQEEVEGLSLITTQVYSVTRYKVTRYLYQAPFDTEAQKEEQFIPLDQLKQAPMASPDRKLIKQVEHLFQ